MTTLVATQALHLSMGGEQKKRRTSKRLAAAADLEQDDDFEFVRMSKRPKTEKKEPASTTTTTTTMKAKTKTTTTKRGGRKAKTAGDDRKRERDSSSPDVMADQHHPPPAGSTRSSTRRRRGRPSGGGASSPPPPAAVAAAMDEEASVSLRRGTRRSLRLSGGVAVDGGGTGTTRGGGGEEGKIQTRRASRGGNEEKIQTRRASRSRNEDKIQTRRASRSADEEKIQVRKSTTRTKKRGNTNDTPVINRNKEMRRKGAPNRRSSLGSRGRRASSLIDNGQAALPHREVDSTDFYKHISADGLPEPRRMKQLLMWCGERALSEKPPHGTSGSHAILGARAIQDQLLKDFASKSEFSDWFSRDEDEVNNRRQVVLKPNPRNAELDEKMAALEAKIARLREEKKAWLLMSKPPPEQARLSFSDESLAAADLDLLDADDRAVARFLGDSEESFAVARTRTEEQLREVHESMALQVDQLADGVHKLEQRVLVAEDEAGQVLRLGAVRLKEREERERERAGTREEETVAKVLRSLSRIMPRGEGDGGG
ncbi:hypothetical protein L249_8845 [Ophiocordyceps polyrhachis-furcata BCC 54312]|uniref:Kinetochore protein mis13 n=1 Tax=Ophiocordyceps polyrhachis-furcata BCC 54312 TaxID=1330021 RepID=A0A367L235_9HYPO|nr:hypothetical protein L249_8845 [Ophiocordyceps polyrhachis-furcata BCC 54312]